MRTLQQLEDFKHTYLALKDEKKTDKEIAELMFIDPTTVYHYKKVLGLTHSLRKKKVLD